MPTPSPFNPPPTSSLTLLSSSCRDPVPLPRISLLSLFSAHCCIISSILVVFFPRLCSISVVLSYGTITVYIATRVLLDARAEMPLADAMMENLLRRDRIAKQYPRYRQSHDSVLDGKVTYGIGIFGTWVENRTCE